MQRSAVMLSLSLVALAHIPDGVCCEQLPELTSCRRRHPFALHHTGLRLRGGGGERPDAGSAKWAQLAEQQGEIVRKMKEEIKADRALHAGEELAEAVAKLKDLKNRASDPMNALEDPLIKRKYDLVRSVGEECVAEAELALLMTRKPDSFVLYDGFEPSGRMHIAQGIFKAMNVNKCTEAGGTFVFWVADWFALMNDKMGGDLDKIKTVGKYLSYYTLSTIMSHHFSAGNHLILPFFYRQISGGSVEGNGHGHGARQIRVELRRNLAKRPRLLDAGARHCTSHNHCSRQKVLPDHGPPRELPHCCSDSLSPHADHRHLLPQSRHLSAGSGSAQSQHVGQRVL